MAKIEKKNARCRYRKNKMIFMKNIRYFNAIGSAFNGSLIRLFNESKMS